MSSVLFQEVRDILNMATRKGVELAPEENNGVNIEDGENSTYVHDQNLEGLDTIRNHLTNDVDGLEFKPNEAMMDKIEELLSNNQELEGAYKDFYDHELTENALMRQG